MTSHIDPISLMMQALEKADALQGKYDDPRYALYMLVAELIARIEGLSSEVADIGNESSAFSSVQMDLQHVDKDIAKIQQWRANHKNMTPMQAMNDPEYKADVQAFANDLQKLQMDANKNGQTVNKNGKSYDQDGMDEASDIANSIMNSKIIWRGDGKEQTIGQMIAGGDMDSLGLALLKGADTSDMTAGTGPFAQWMNGQGSAQGLKTVEQDFGMFVTNFNQTLNTDGTYLQQIDQSGQNDINSMNALMNVIVNNLRSS